MKSKIPTHGLLKSDYPIQLRELEHQNNYDFTQKHRHSYFEIIFFTDGGGKQLIDFTEYEVKSNSCYVVYPQQIHLLKRDPKSSGFLFQFQNESLVSSKLHKLLQERKWHGANAIFFEQNKDIINQFEKIVELFKTNEGFGNKFEKENRYHLLHIVLYQLLSLDKEKQIQQTHDSDFYQFLHLIDNYYKENHTVKFYVEQMVISEKKLGSLTKKYLDQSPLKAIHQRILLEAKRLLLFGEQSHKEIALDLGFDSPASFSAFIKKKCGLNPSELQQEIAEIHNG